MSDTPASPPAGRYQSFQAFYPFYISEHANQTSRRLHVIGTGLVIAALFAGVFWSPWFFAAAPVVGYFFAWVGHFFFEKNTPATFTYPLWSLMGDFRLFFETVSGRRRF
ncbi:MAG: Mpo1-like protein [Caulobacterales bacterium]